MFKKKQQSSERQRGYQLHDSAGLASRDAEDNLIFELVYAQDPEPTAPADGSRWVKVWDNKITTTTEVEPWIDSSTG